MQKHVSLAISCLYLFEQGTRVPKSKFQSLIHLRTAIFWSIFKKKKTPIMSFLKHGWSFLRKKKEFPLHKDDFTKFSLNWFSCSGKISIFFKNHHCIVPNLFLSLVLKGCEPSFERLLILYPNDPCEKFGYNFLWPVTLEREFFLNFVNIVFAISLLSPL